MRSNNKRSVILEAALQVVQQQGANHLTIDAVAAEAGVSKGGVLYHFSSKRALLIGMLEQLIAANQARVERSRQTRSRFAASLHLDDRMTTAEQRTSLALLAAAGEAPDLLDPAREYMKAGMQEALADVQDINPALLLILANEGLRFLDILDLNPLARDQVESVIAYMNDLAEDI